MRLIDTNTLCLVKKRDDEIPSYATLSHTWGRDEEEITQQEMEQILATRASGNEFHDPCAKRKGFIKISNAAEVARLQKYDWIWIDTCCIDKTSSAELSEAVNSMYRWYNECAVCFTYLNEVMFEPQDNDPFQYERTLPDEIIRQIKDSRWFTRGWTLQELVAPKSMLFFSSTWHPFGSKESLQDLLFEVTGIDRNLLSGTALVEDFSVADRMKWASSRGTTRVEDLAYCLMGIFNVNMPLLYGEGSRSFIRLQEEILRMSMEQTIFAVPY